MRTTPLAALLALLGFALLVLGCDGTHLAGTHDAELVYKVDPATSPPPSPASSSAAASLTSLSARARSRLAVGHIACDVDDADPTRLKIILDADSVDTAEDLLRWRGGLTFAVIDPTVRLAPGGVGVTEKSATEGGVEEHWLEGPGDAVARAAAAAKPPPGRRVLVQTLDASKGTARTRVVVDPPLLDVPQGVERVQNARDGHAVAITLTTGARFDIGVALPAKADVAVLRGRAVLEVKHLTAGDLEPLTIDFGNDIYSFARAERLKGLLTTPPLPHLERESETPVPADWGLAVVCLVLPMILSFAWLFFVRRFDRHQPEPFWLVLVTFALGGLSVIPAGFAEYAYMTASPWLNPSLVTFGGQIRAFPLALAVFTLVVGLSEEGGKFLGTFVFAARRREFDEPVDGIVYGAASALGFAAVENIKYFAVGRLTPTLIVLRTFTSVPGHMFFGAIWGYALGRKLIRPRTSVILFLLWAALMHGAFDTFLSINGMQLLSPLENLGLASLFVVLLRSALRFGARAKGPGVTAPPDDHRRTTFGLGSSGAFAAWTVALHVLAFAVFLVGVYVEIKHHRVGWVFLSVASSMVMGLGIAAYGVASALPLDAVLDAEGVTFAGALRPWSEITSVERRRASSLFGGSAELWLRSPRGDLRVGPGSPHVVEGIARVVEREIAQQPRPPATAPAPA